MWASGGVGRYLACELYHSPSGFPTSLVLGRLPCPRSISLNKGHVAQWIVGSTGDKCGRVGVKSEEESTVRTGTKWPME